MLGSLFSEFIFYPAVRLQTSLQLAPTSSTFSASEVKNAAVEFVNGIVRNTRHTAKSAYLGGGSYISSKVLGLGTPIFYGLERNQILRVAGREEQVIRSLKGIFTSSAYTGFSLALAKYAIIASLASLSYATQSILPAYLGLALYVPIDTIRRNFVVANTLEKISYQQVISNILTKDGGVKALYRGIWAYPTLYVLFIASSALPTTPY